MRDKLPAKQVKAEADAVRSILTSWDPVPGSPRDEYDCLVDHIISALHGGRSRPDEISSLIATEMHDHFGIATVKTEVEGVAASIAEYWERSRGGSPV